MEDTFSVRPSVCFEVQKITGVSIGNGNQKNYQVQWAPSWVSGFHLVGCEHLIEEFIHKQSEKGQLVDDISATSITSGGDLQKDVSWDDNVTDFTYRQQFNGDICKRASMVVNDDHLFENPEGNIKVICMDTNVSNGNVCINEIDDTNPNFEWVERNVQHVRSSEDTDKDNPHADDHILTAIGEDDVTSPDVDHVVAPLHFGKSFINSEKGGSDNVFLNEVKEEIILVETPETNQTGVSENKDNWLNNRVKENKCKVCGKIFKNTFTLKRHCKKSSHCGSIIAKELKSKACPPMPTDKEERSYKCRFCQKTYVNSSSLNRHLRVHADKEDMIVVEPPESDESDVSKNRENKQVESYKCKMCDKVFKNAYSLKRHANKSLQCGKGSRKYESRAALHAHSQTRQRSHKCSFCDKAFFTSTELKRHIRVHTGERPYQCKVCKKSFKTSGHLRKHSETHRGNT